ncbi:hypothetical protein BDR07DRAFT_1382927 [Suillus spraguei]|nr:hypothetical protein BDR07DRAFT_1382927 [Suillus spraguei]
MGRKGKKKAADPVRVLMRTGCITYNGHIKETTSVMLDTRPVKAMQPENDMAAENRRLEAALEKAQLGIGKINLLHIGNPLKFGTYNDRPLKPSEVNKMLTSFEKFGIQSFDPRNALAIVIEPTRLSPNQTLTGTWTDPDTIKRVKFEDGAPLIMASGQHRVAALQKGAKKSLESEKSFSGRIAALEKVTKPTMEQGEEHDLLKKQLALLKGRLETEGEWGVILYDKGPIKDWISMGPIENGLLKRHLIDIIEGNKELAAHLSRNEVLHTYRETHEEKLVSILRDMADRFEEEGQDGALQGLNDALNQPTFEKNSKTTKVLHCSRLMLTLMQDILPMGPHYRARRELFTLYMKYQGSILRLLATKEDFPTYKEVCKIVKVSEGDDDESEDAQKRLSELHLQIFDPEEHEDAKIFSPFLSEIDTIASTCFKSYVGLLSAWNSDYEMAMQLYRNDVIDALRKGFKQMPVRTKDEMLWHDRITARTYVWLTPIVERGVMPMPLMTGVIMDRVWEELNAVKEGYRECARWFEPLLDSLKILVPYTHAVDDHTEALFRAIDRERGIDRSTALSSAWLLLWEGRMSTVLQLHNLMSTSDRLAHMKKRPSTKEMFMEKWNNMSDSQKASATSLHQAVKKYLGKGPIDMPASMLNMPGMYAFMRSGWEWQRKGLVKHRTREGEPVISAIFMEQEFAATYRLKVLQDPLVWSLRHSLEEVMNSNLPRPKLKSAKAGSSATGRTWKYSDGIVADKPAEDATSMMDEDAQQRQLKLNRCIAAENADREAILKLIKFIKSMSLARVSQHKTSKLSIEVADAVNTLVETLELSASRNRLRILSGIDHIMFDVYKDLKSLNIPLVEGEVDPYTVIRSEHHPSHDVSQHHTAIAEEPLAAANDTSRKGKGKASDATMLEEKEDADFQEDVDMTGAADTSEAPVAPETSDIGKAPVDLADTAETSKTSEAPLVSKPRPRPRPKPIAVKLAMAADSAKVDHPLDEVVPATTASKGSLEPPGECHPQESASEGVVTLDSPLSSSDETTINAAPQDINMPEDLKLVQDYELVEERDLLDSQRRSSRKKRLSVPRAAPSACAAGHSSATPLSERHSGTPEGSLLAKRSRIDACLSSPENRKKAKQTSLPLPFILPADKDVNPKQ